MSRRSKKSKSLRQKAGAGEAPRKWTPKEIKLLGKMSDSQVAKKLGRTKDSIANKRLRLGIAQCYGDHYRPWTKKESALLGKYSDREVARRIGKSYAAVAGRRRARNIPNRHLLVRPWTKEELAILHRVRSHAEVSRLVNRTMEAVSQKRDRLTRARKRKRSSRS